ncbi:alcohol dehydrogenase [Sporothrix brasiliensis 5110]|uniref:Alcohol dehydrogenase n=1 Tax=Sporothrix brasiliensis 5110 TaxID=1398154 RepID=A0A0C2IXA2_9PEZI|nr:alcohol dehydrogenase [Sporothrix brasiliensis 5110]KIH91395.1 alcohol dehydrogenase [Sporothrix brasiliensis 5110]
MKGLVYKGKGTVRLEEVPAPQLVNAGDAIIKMKWSTICGTDLHIRHGNVASVPVGQILGHEGVGIVAEAGPSVKKFKKGDRVLIPAITSCASCDYCRRGMHSHCHGGGWILGNTTGGTQAEYVRIPHADSSLYALPAGVDESTLVMLSDIFPTGFECGVQNGKVAPGSVVAIVGAGPVGLAALITSQLYSPAQIIMVDFDDNRLAVSLGLGATHTVNNGRGMQAAVDEIMALTGGVGCDAVLEAVGVPASFELCQRILAPGGTLANIGVHGSSAPLLLDQLWDRNISITTRLVDTVTLPMLLKLVAAKRIDPSLLITHRFKFADMEKAYETFGAAAKHKALKVLIEYD